jgi:hypothetical protein
MEQQQLLLNAPIESVRQSIDQLHTPMTTIIKIAAQSARSRKAAAQSAKSDEAAAAWWLQQPVLLANTRTNTLVMQHTVTLR